MKKITVYADFDFLAEAEAIGTLGYERVRGKDHFVFEYNRTWLKNHAGILLSGDVLQAPSLQHPRSDDGIFGFVKDSFPDRWGRLLLDRRERLMAQAEQRSVRQITGYDYLVGIEDLTRMGGIRFKAEDEKCFVGEGDCFKVPPIESLGALCEACHELEQAEERNTLPEKRWLDQLVDPGTSLGGARPKANVIDADGRLYVAKFPSKKDLEDTELIEHFAHVLAASAGINVAKTRVQKISKNRHLLISERFDRTNNGQRVHFASAMSLLGLNDGCGGSTGHGYIDIVDFMLQGCVGVEHNLKELYRRVTFNVLFGNTDDHFRNHGFLLTPKGWTLAPAYDINPSFRTYQSLLIDPYTDDANVESLRKAHHHYMIESDIANEIIEQVRDAIKSWRHVATQLHIAPHILEQYTNRWDNC